MKLGLLGDIHAEDERLAAALAVFAAERTDQVLFVGDVVDGQGDVDRCCALLTDVRARGVRGNHDRWLLSDTMRTLPHAHHRRDLAPASVALLESLPEARPIETPLGMLLLCHGVGDDDMTRLGPSDDGYALLTNDPLKELLRKRYAIVVGGHTHQRMVRRFAAGDVGLAGDASLAFVNAGTLARHAAPCCAVLDCAARVVTFFDLEDPRAPGRAETVTVP